MGSFFGFVKKIRFVCGDLVLGKAPDILISISKRMKKNVPFSCQCSGKVFFFGGRGEENASNCIIGQ